MNEFIKPAKNVVFFSDTTLRDGEQMAGASMSVAQKVEIAKALKKLGVHSADIGFPACGQGEIEAIQRIVKEAPLPLMTALCRTKRRDIDMAAEAFKDCHRLRCSAAIFLGTSPSHRDTKLNMSKEDVLDEIRAAITYAKQSFEFVSFSPEDASRTEPEFLIDVYNTAIDAGARTIGFTDTLGILTPEKTRNWMRKIMTGVAGIDKVYFAIHLHNDLGLATANTLAAIDEGVQIVQCTINGIGERAGNTSLEEVVTAMLINRDQYPQKFTIKPHLLTEISRLVERHSDIAMAVNKPVVGRNIFTTEAGIHQDGILKDPQTYVPFMPKLVGGPDISLTLGKHSGRAAIDAALRRLDIDLSKEQLNQLAEDVKDAAKSDWADPDRLLSTTVSRLFG
jgi:2-isopropylmalate synthase